MDVDVDVDVGVCVGVYVGVDVDVDVEIDVDELDRKLCDSSLKQSTVTVLITTQEQRTDLFFVVGLN